VRKVSPPPESILVGEGLIQYNASLVATNFVFSDFKFANKMTLIDLDLPHSRVLVMNIQIT